MILHLLRDCSKFPVTRADAEKLSKKVDLTTVEAIDCRGVYSASHCFADELFKRIGHDAKILRASEYVENIMEAGRSTAKKDWHV
jgi:hypothetical protein